MQPFHAAFSWPVRVYYEDTDAGGVVYYANYLKYFERCRTEWLRAAGVDQAALRDTAGLQFVVTELSTEYHKPARLDDLLVIGASLTETARSFVVFEQRAWCGSEPVARARVKVVCVDARRLVPRRLPEGFVSRLQAAEPRREQACMPICRS